jgi:hypothetical protein
MASVAAKPGQRAGRRFYIGVGVFLILWSIAGFGPSLIDPSKRLGPPTPLVLTHGAVTALFFLLYLAQTFLVANGRTAIHRRLGIAGAILALAVVVLGFITSIEAQRRGYDLSGDLARTSTSTPPFPPGDVIFPLLLFFNFGVLVAAALWYRHRPEIHKRLMLLAALTALGNEPLQHLVGRLAIHWPGLAGALNGISIAVLIVTLSVSAIHDRLTEGRIHPVSLWVPIGLFAWFSFVAFAMAPSAAWLRFADRLILGK